MPSSKQLLKQFEKEERGNNVNVIIVFTMVVLGHSVVEINHQLQKIHSLVKEDDEESKDNESSIDNENKDEMSMISGSVDFGLEVFEKNIDGAIYPAYITIPKTVTVQSSAL